MGSEIARTLIVGTGVADLIWATKSLVDERVRSHRGMSQTVGGMREDW